MWRLWIYIALLIVPFSSLQARELPRDYREAFTSACLERSSEALCGCLLDELEARYRESLLTDGLDRETSLAIRDACVQKLYVSEASPVEPAEEEEAEPGPSPFVQVTEALRLRLVAGELDVMVEQAGDVGYVLTYPSELGDPVRVDVGPEAPLSEADAKQIEPFLDTLSERWVTDEGAGTVSLTSPDGTRLMTLTWVENNAVWKLRQVALTDVPQNPEEKPLP